MVGANALAIEGVWWKDAVTQRVGPGLLNAEEEQGALFRV